MGGSVWGVYGGSTGRMGGGVRVKRRGEGRTEAAHWRGRCGGSAAAGSGQQAASSRQQAVGGKRARRAHEGDAPLAHRLQEGGEVLERGGGAPQPQAAQVLLPGGLGGGWGAMEGFWGLEQSASEGKRRGSGCRCACRARARFPTTPNQTKPHQTKPPRTRQPAPLRTPACGRPPRRRWRRGRRRGRGAGAPAAPARRRPPWCPHPRPPCPARPSS